MLQLELNDIQGLILSGYGHLKASRYFFFQIEQPNLVKTWLATIAEKTTSAAPWPKGPDGKTIKPTTTLNVAFTYVGLNELGVPLEGFSAEFCEGLAHADPEHPGRTPNRSRRLGDVGASDPANWEFGGTTNPPLHIMLLIFADDKAGLDQFQKEVLPAPEQIGLKVLAVEDVYRPEHNREPFGFQDGMSQPLIEGSVTGQTSDDPGQPVIKAGEFILGYRNQYNLLPPAPTHPQLKMNGTYLVYRKMEQDIAAFWSFLYQQAKGQPELAEYFGAKMVGRWPSGAPLTLAPEKDDPALGADESRSNNFQYNEPDVLGYGCPVGSHIRRANPRDSLVPGPLESTDAVSKHRILRRGRVYGPEYPADILQALTRQDGPDNSVQFVDEAGSPRGLSFIALNTDIKRQFEFVQQTWINDPKFDGLYDNPDPLITTNAITGRANAMTIQRWPVRHQIQNVPDFVTVKAGGYFFLPSMQGLRFIARQ